MAVIRVGTLRWHVTGNETISADWNYLSGNSGSWVNNHWTVVRPPNLNGVTTAVVDMGLNTVVADPRLADRLTLSNGSFPSTSRWVLGLNGVEYVDAPLNQTVHLTVSTGIGFTTNGSLASLRTGVGNHELRYTGATRDSTLFTGVGWDPVRLIDHPDVGGTQYWAVVRRDHGQVDAYSLYSGYRIRMEGGGTTWGNTGGIINYGEVDEIYAASRNRPNGDVFNPGIDLQGAGDRGSFDNIDLSNEALAAYTDRFVAASFKSIHYATQNVYTGTAIVETFNGDRNGGTQSASRDHITTNGNQHLLVNEEQIAIDGHLRLYVRDNNSGLYNRFNEIYLGTSAAEVNANDYSTTSKNAYQNPGNGNGAGAVKVLGTAMYGFGGNDALTGGDDTDYLFGGVSTYTTIPGVLQGNIVTGGDGGDFFGVGNVSVGLDGDAIMTTNFTARLAGTAPSDSAPEGQLARIGAAETADLATRVATDRIQDWTASVDSLRVLANGTAVIDGLGTANGAGGAYSLDLIGNDAERIDMSGNRVNNEGKTVIRGLGGNDTIIGSDGADWIYGNGGNNVVIAGAAAAGDGNDRIFYDTYVGRLFATGFDAGDKVYVNKKILEAISGTWGTLIQDNLTANGTTLSGAPVFDTQDYTAAVAYDAGINFLHDSFYGPSGGLPTNSQHENGPGFADGSDNYADTSTGIIGAGMYAAGLILNVIGAGAPLMAAGLALGAGAVAGSLGWTKPHQHATYTGDIRSNFLTILTAQSSVDTTVAADGNANIDNRSFLDFFASANAGDGYTPAVQFTSLGYGNNINQFMAVHSDEETFIYWVYSRGDTVVSAGEAIKIAEINGRLFAEDFAIYDGALDVYNFDTLTPIVIYTPSITAVRYDRNSNNIFTDAGDVALIGEKSAVVLDGGGRFVLEGKFFRTIGDQANPFTTTAGSSTVTVNYNAHGRANGDWIQIDGATAANGIDFNGAYQIANVTANSFTITANKFTASNGVAGVTAGNALSGTASFGIPGTISAGSTIKVYDGVDRLDANAPLTPSVNDVSASVNGDSFTLIDTRAIGTSITQSPDGVVTFDSGSVAPNNRYEDSQGNAASLSITQGSSTVTVNYTAHGMQVGNAVQIIGATTAGGINFNGTWVVTGVTANTFTFTAATNASATQTVGTEFSFTAVSAPVVVAQADINGGGGVLTVNMASHGMLSGDRVTFTSTFNAGNFLYSANSPYMVTRINDGQFSITSSVNNAGGTTTPANVTFSVPNGGDQTFFLKDEKVSYFVEITNADTGFEAMSLQYDFTVGGGNGILNGGRGSDTLVLSDDSAALNGMADSQIVNLETIMVTNEAPDTILLNLSNQTDGFTIYDSSASNSIIGSRGNDDIRGQGGNDSLNGDDGNDTITGGAGADNMDGGAGDDVFIIAAASDHAGSETITGGDDTDVIRFTSTAGGTLVLTVNVNVEEVRISDAAGFTTGTTSENIDASAVAGAVTIALTGNAGANVLTGNAAANVITGGGGNDTITGNGGNDTINAGSGTNSILDAGGGADTIEHDQAGSTVAIAVTGTDTVTLTASQVGATANSEAGVHTTVNASTSTAAVTLNGNTGNDTLTGGSGNDTITGGLGNDLINAGAGTNSVTDAGQGTDTIRHDQAGSTVAVAVIGTGTVTLTASQMGATANSEAGVHTTVNASTSTSAVTLNGNTGNDTLTGGSGNDTLNGGAGNDSLAGNNGNDGFRFLSAHFDSNDTVAGNADSDTIEITDDATVVDADFTNVTSVETLLLSGAGAQDVTLDTASNTAGIRTVTATAGMASTIDIGATTAGLAVSTNAGNDTVTAGSGADNISTGTGDDVIRFLSANFTSADTVAGGDNNDTIRITDDATVVDADFTNVTSVETLLLSGTGAQNVTLGAASDTAGIRTVTATAGTASTIDIGATTAGLAVSTNAGNDTITGGSGNDRIDGGGGADYITGGGGADRFVFAAGDSGSDLATADIIFDFKTGDDTIQIIGGAGGVSIIDGTTKTFGQLQSDAFNWFSFIGGTNQVMAAWNANGSGNAWVFINYEPTATFMLTDALIILTGIDTTNEIAIANFF